MDGGHDQRGMTSLVIVTCGDEPSADGGSIQCALTISKCATVHMSARLTQQDDVYDAIVTAAVRESTDPVPITQSAQKQLMPTVALWSANP